MKTCPVCQREHQRQGIYCSRKCCRRVSNAKARGSTVRPPIVSFDCEQCGTRCVPGENVAAHASRFCGYDCKAAWHKAHVELPERLISSVTAAPTDHGFRPVLRRDPCVYCGARPSGVDHIVPTSAGGADDSTNWAGCCKRCNGAKGDLPLLIALLWVPVSRGYHDLRRELWHAHA